MCRSCAHGGKPLAAIWARVSGQDQRELSPDSQEVAVNKVLREQGYQAPEQFVIKVVWTSLDLMSCPEFQQLRGWVADGSIHAVGMLDRDRLQAQGLQRLIFLSDCKDQGVQIVIAQGPPMLDGGEGQLVELALALGKERSVLRAQQGAKDGLRDRARLKGLPVTGVAPYGYRFRYEEPAGSRVPVALEPEPSTYVVACRIWRMALEGHSMRAICRAIDVPSPKGLPIWHPSTIHRILGNPAYAGVYHALRQEMKTPQVRRKPRETYGKTSSRSLPREEWYPLPDFPVIDPVVAWEEWEEVQARLELNQRHSRRNGKRFYLLRGMMTCPNHPRKLAGHARGERYWYECPVRRGHDVGTSSTRCPRVAGPDAEARVWQRISEFLSDPELFMAELNSRRQSIVDIRPEVREKIAAEERKLAEVTRQETQLVNLKLQHLVSQEALERSAALLRARRAHHLEEIERQKEVMATAEHARAAAESLEVLRTRIADRLESATPEDRRKVLEALDSRITLTGSGLDISIGVPSRADYVHQPQGQ